MGLYNGSGTLVAQYLYDSWGKVESVLDGTGKSITDANHVGNLNPFRFRGYYYDTESGFYYLMSRYYDPIVHRFINGDGYFQSGEGLLDTNMNAYCDNNPVNTSDSTGEDNNCPNHGNHYFQSNCVYCRPDYQKTLDRQVRRQAVKNEVQKEKQKRSQQKATSEAYSYTSTSASLVTGSVFTAGSVAGMSTATGIGASSFLSVLTMPMSVAGHATNPYLTNTQKGMLIATDMINPALGILLSVTLVNVWNPTGWVGLLAIGAITTAYTITSIYAQSKMEEDFMASNGW